MNYIAPTIPDAVHVCQQCMRSVASGFDRRGRPQRCGYCERRGTPGRNIAVGFGIGLVIGAVGLPVVFLVALLR